MIVFVAGMPRAGSMWTYNVVRELIKSKNIKVLPETLPIDPVEMILLKKKALESKRTDDVIFCIKTHSWLANPLPTTHDVKIICNIRDVRDAMLSYMKFTHEDHESGIKAMVGMMGTTDYYIDTFKDNMLVVRYEQIIEHALDILDYISNFINVHISGKKKIDIVNKFSKENTKRYIKEFENVKIDKDGAIKGAKYVDKFKTIRNFDGTYRVVDMNTALQTNHITSTKEGEWREYFDDPYLAQINELSREWLLKFGYAV